MGGPEETLLRVRTEASDELAYHKAFPGSANFWMALHIYSGRQVEKRMQQSAVGNIDLRGFHLPFAHIGKPRGQLVQHQGRGELVQVMPDRCGCNAKGTRQLSTMPNLRM